MAWIKSSNWHRQSHEPARPGHTSRQMWLAGTLAILPLMWAFSPGRAEEISYFEQLTWPILTTDLATETSRPFLDVAAYRDSSDTANLLRYAQIEPGAPGSAQSILAVPEGKWSKPVVSRIRRELYDPVAAQRYEIRITLGSRVQKEGDTYTYSYSILNEGKTPVRLEWASVEESAFGSAAREFFRPKYFESGSADHTFTQKSSAPQINDNVVKIYLPGDRYVGTAWAPVYVPKREQ